MSYLYTLESNIRRYEPVYFCHNDLHNENILKSEKGLTIIDFDHANYGYRGFDLAYWLHHTVVGNSNVFYGSFCVGFLEFY